MKITKEIIERIEGEATLELEWSEGKIDFAKIKFMNYRGMEKILEKRPLYDALALTPRVCGICSHSHALASVLAIEACFKNAGEPLAITQKAKDIREIVLNAEKIHNHIKWYFFSIYPELQKIMGKPSTYAFRDTIWFEAQKAITESLKMGAIFSGQWPHGSFVMAGGVTCDPLKMDVITAQNSLESVMHFCETYLFGVALEEFLSFHSFHSLVGNETYLSRGIEQMLEKGYERIGRSYDRFLALGESHMYLEPSKCLKTHVVGADTKFVQESLEHTFFEDKTQGYTYSKSALYKKSYCEVGPLARLMIGKDLLIRESHRRFRDSALTRIIARMCECAHLLQRTRELLLHVNIHEPSFIAPSKDVYDICSHGEGIVEAPRGSLMHKVEVRHGYIDTYDIITPTVWNLGNGDKQIPSIAQKAIIGLENVEEANFVFKSFDVCSVCTTQ